MGKRVPRNYYFLSSIYFLPTNCTNLHECNALRKWRPVRSHEFSRIQTFSKPKLLVLCDWKALRSVAMVTGYAVPGKVRRERRAWKALRHRTCPKHPPLHCISEIRATEQVAIKTQEKEIRVNSCDSWAYKNLSWSTKNSRPIRNFSPGKTRQPSTYFINPLIPSC